MIVPAVELCPKCGFERGHAWQDNRAKDKENWLYECDSCHALQSIVINLMSTRKG